MRLNPECGRQVAVQTSADQLATVRKTRAGNCPNKVRVPHLGKLIVFRLKNTVEYFWPIIMESAKFIATYAGCTAKQGLACDSGARV